MPCISTVVLELNSAFGTFLICIYYVHYDPFNVNNYTSLIVLFRLRVFFI